MTKNQRVRKGFPTKKAAETSHFSVYDGHQHLGSVIGNKAAGFKAIPPRGKSLGTFQTITPQQVAELDGLASQYGAVAAAMEQTYAEQSRSMQLQQELGSIANSTFSGLVDGTQSWGDALQSVTRRLTDLVLQAALLGDGPLGGMFGTAASGGKGGGLIGGLFKAFGFAEGGVMTPQGPRRLKRYAGGGISRTAAIFGEAGAEAAVPLPDGRRIPVDLKTNMPSTSRGGSSGSDIRLSVTQNIDARGSEMSEERMATLLKHSNAQLLAQVKRGLPAMLKEYSQRGTL